MFSWLKVLLWSAIGLVALSALIWQAYQRDMAAIHARLARDAQRAETSFGAVEYASWGDGPAVLALHGAGGGFDQGMVLARGFGPEGVTWIAPSRFGYLGSDLPGDASTAAQADALEELLHSLGVGKVAVLAMSGGVPPALQLAERHPGRVSGMVLLSSAPFTPLPTQQNELPIPIWLYQALFRSDLAFWLLQKLAPGQLDAAFDMPPGARAHLPAPDAAFVDAMVATFLPVSGRTAGLANEGAAIDPGARHDLARITVPVLVVHAADDGINPVSIAEYIAAEVPYARLIVIPSGGHLLLGHHTRIRQDIAAFLHQISENR